MLVLLLVGYYWIFTFCIVISLQRNVKVLKKKMVGKMNRKDGKGLQMKEGRRRR
jgi:hypothetical protein